MLLCGFVIILIGILKIDAQSFQSCRTPNGEMAECISIYRCSAILQAISSQNPEQIKFIRESQCGYDNPKEPFVCCGSVANFKTNPVGRRLPETPVSKPTFMPDRSQCGFQLYDKIYGGNATSFDEFPWMVLLQYRNKLGKTNFYCGGSLISSRYVLTAAHCITGAIKTAVGPLVHVRLGEYNTETEVDCVQNGNFRICNDRPLDISIEETIVHPEYKESNINRYHDIALIRLNRDVTYTDFIKPICLPDGSEQSQIGDNLIVSGWGRISNTQSFSPVKLKVEVPFADRNACSSKFRSAGITLGSGQICAGGMAGKDSCTGDSGGPLMTTSKSDSSQWYIEGLVSFGARCGTDGWPAVYTKVSLYLNWIYSTVKQ